MGKQYEVYFEEHGKSRPRLHEERIAKIVANYFESDIVFLKRYSSKTPDLYVLKTNLRWELKSPQGGGKHTIQNNLRATDGQSENVILDLSRAKMTDEQGISRAREFVKGEHSRIKRLKVLTKKQIMVDIKD
ncbi:hypothetical protein J5868_01395 [Candidatus Saccharibacteria bacterium]|nr:hypothetical protein [Candidatus Saccharibacteria bacterium]